ncbi:FlgB family protein [Tropicimonas sp.]|uniref:FlgB family protein n=1 Tax=Tropicimonas sp. TaxID=2067044 RepID=UPI003A894221
MIDRLEVLQMAQALAGNAGARQAMVAQNIANVDTPGYRAVDIAEFSEFLAADTPAAGMRATRKGHAVAPEAGFPQHIAYSGASPAPNGNTVSLEEEMMKIAEIRQQHEMALAIYKSGLSVVRSGLGRG